jgi:hypothetical protein
MSLRNVGKLISHPSFSNNYTKLLEGSQEANRSPNPEPDESIPHPHTIQSGPKAS